jgi:hypothetical protein
MNLDAYTPAALQSAASVCRQALAEGIPMDDLIRRIEQSMATRFSIEEVNLRYSCCSSVKGRAKLRTELLVSK